MEFSNNQNLCKKETITLHLPFKVAEIRHAGKTVKKKPPVLKNSGIQPLRQKPEHLTDKVAGWL